MAQEVAVEKAAVAAAPQANPAALGLASFALTTFVLSASNAGWIPASANTLSTVISLAFFYGGLGQIITALWEFRAGNTFGASAFASYGGFWLSFGWIVQTKEFTATSLGWYLLAWGIFTVLWTLGLLRSNGALLATFIFLILTFFLLAASFLGAGALVGQIGGYAGVITALLAWYTATAILLSTTNSPIQLPLFPLA